MVAERPAPGGAGSRVGHTLNPPKNPERVGETTAQSGPLSCQYPLPVRGSGNARRGAKAALEWGLLEGRTQHVKCPCETGRALAGPHVGGLPSTGSRYIKGGLSPAACPVNRARATPLWAGRQAGITPDLQLRHARVTYTGASGAVHWASRVQTYSYAQYICPCKDSKHVRRTLVGRARCARATVSRNSLAAEASSTGHCASSHRSS